MSNLKSIVEAMIFASPNPLSIDKLSEIIPEFEKQDIKSAIKELSDDYAFRNGGINLYEVAGGWQFKTDPSYHPYILKMLKTKAAKLSNSSLETLAIIAYKQPVTRVEIEHLRGVDAGGVIKSLLEKKLIKILGKKDIPGRPIIYGTSKEFLELFGLKDLKSLPTLKEIQSLDDGVVYELQEELPLPNLHKNETEEDIALPFGG